MQGLKQHIRVKRSFWGTNALNGVGRWGEVRGRTNPESTFCVFDCFPRRR
jgi:hypothetical protein